jgi:hypothetical protein
LGYKLEDIYINFREQAEVTTNRYSNESPRSSSLKGKKGEEDLDVDLAEIGGHFDYDELDFENISEI